MKAFFASMRPQAALMLLCLGGLFAAALPAPAFSQSTRSETAGAGSISGPGSIAGAGAGSIAGAGAGSTGLPLPRIPETPRERVRALTDEALSATGRDTAGRDTAGRDTAGRDTTGRDTAGRDTAGRDAPVAADAPEPGRDTTADRTTPQLPLPQLSADLPRPPATPAATDGAGTPRPAATPARDEVLGIELEGIASWYGGKFQGRLTANGETFDTNQLTAAHQTLPFGTLVRVHNPANGSSVVVRINDRGPFVDNRIIDLSRAGADAIGMTAHGIAPVRLEIMHVPNNHQFHTIQVASFGNRGSANELRDRLRASGIEAAIESPTEPPVHRVIVQGVAVDEVDVVRADLSRLGYDNVLVRRR